MLCIVNTTQSSLSSGYYGVWCLARHAILYCAVNGDGAAIAASEMRPQPIDLMRAEVIAPFYSSSAADYLYPSELSLFLFTTLSGNKRNTKPSICSQAQTLERQRRRCKDRS